jgi:hypothetical protein
MVDKVAAKEPDAERSLMHRYNIGKGRCGCGLYFVRTCRDSKTTFTDLQVSLCTAAGMFPVYVEGLGMLSSFGHSISRSGHSRILYR